MGRRLHEFQKMLWMVIAEYHGRHARGTRAGTSYMTYSWETVKGTGVETLQWAGTEQGARSREHGAGRREYGAGGRGSEW